MIKILSIDYSEVDSSIKGVRHQLNDYVSFEIRYWDSKAAKVKGLSYTYSLHGDVIAKDYRFSASIPYGFHSIIGDPLDEEFKVPSLIHDHMCDQGDNGELRDKAFRFLLKEEGVDKCTTRIMYKAVVKYRKITKWFKGLL